LPQRLYQIGTKLQEPLMVTLRLQYNDATGDK
jgi:hypothetical protein